MEKVYVSVEDLRNCDCYKVYKLGSNSEKLYVCTCCGSDFIVGKSFKPLIFSYRAALELVQENSDLIIEKM